MTLKTKQKTNEYDLALAHGRTMTGLVSKCLPWLNAGLALAEFMKRPPARLQRTGLKYFTLAEN